MWPEHKAYRDEQGTSRMQNDLDQRLSPQDTERGMLRTAASRTKPISVAIVGAGFSGLRCADVLLQHGCKVTIFEARNRLGGRVAQSNHLGHVVDLGPNWIHGTDNNPILTIAKATGTQLNSWDESMVVHDTDGSTIDADEAGEYAQKLWEDVIPSAFKFSNDHNASIDPNRSLYDFVVEKAEKMFLDEPEEVAKRKRKTFLLAAGVWGSYIGSPVSRQSLKYFWLEECIEGENPFVAGTYTKILAAVEKRAKKDATVKLNTKVVEITSKEPESLDQAKDWNITVETADGAREEFDEVVVTSPLGYLKRNHTTLFQPALPPRLTQAISNISYGTLDKVYITFPSAYWDTPASSNPIPSTNTHTTPNVHAKTMPLHQAPSSDPAPHYPPFTHWLPPTYAPDTNPEQWDIQCMNLAALPAESAHPTLLFYTYGSCSTYIAHLSSTASSPTALSENLLALFKPYYTRLPNYAPSNPACIPKAVLATAWAGDEMAGYGAYANFQVGLERGDEDVECMRRGMPERGVWLAGEHTAPFVALGTSTGAYWSGDGVGRRIVEGYGLQSEGSEV